MVNLDEAVRVRAVANVLRVVEVAEELGCRLITSHLWGLPAKGARERETEMRELFLQSIGELSATLAARDVHLNFMPHPGGFIEESDATLELIRDAACGYVGYTYGISHGFVINRPGQTVTDMISHAGQTLTHVLVSDTHDVHRIIAPPEVKAHEHTVPGRGDVDFPEVLAALQNIGYDRMLCVHLISERDRIEGAVRETREQVEQWLRKTMRE